MIDLNTKFGGSGCVVRHTGTASLCSLTGRKVGGDAGKEEGLFKSSSVQPEQAAQADSSSLRTVRLKYMPTCVYMTEKGCYAYYSNPDGGSWDVSEMTEDEWAFLMDSLPGLAQGLGIDPKSVPIYIVPPEVTQRMNLDEAYSDYLFSKCQGGAPGHRLVVDLNGTLTDLDADELIRVSQEDDEEDKAGDDFWKARLERQAEYMRIVEEKRVEHSRELARRLAVGLNGALTDLDADATSRLPVWGAWGRPASP